MIERCDFLQPVVCLARDRRDQFLGLVRQLVECLGADWWHKYRARDSNSANKLHVSEHRILPRNFRLQTLKWARSSRYWIDVRVKMSGESWNTPRSICSSKTIVATTPAVKIIDRPDVAAMSSA
jgi:hypothetical protein